MVSVILAIRSMIPGFKPNACLGLVNVLLPPLAVELSLPTQEIVLLILLIMYVALSISTQYLDKLTIFYERSLIIQPLSRAHQQTLPQKYTLADRGGEHQNQYNNQSPTDRFRSAYARVVFQNSVLPNLINPVGWTTLASPAYP